MSFGEQQSRNNCLTIHIMKSAEELQLIQHTLKCTRTFYMRTVKYTIYPKKARISEEAEYYCKQHCKSNRMSKSNQQAQVNLTSTLKIYQASVEPSIQWAFVHCLID